MSLYTKNCPFFGTSPKGKGHGLSFLFTPLVSTLVPSLENRYLTSLLYIIQKIMIFIYYCSLLNNEHEYLVIYLSILQSVQGKPLYEKRSFCPFELHSCSNICRTQRSSTKSILRCFSLTIYYWVGYSGKLHLISIYKIFNRGQAPFGISKHVIQHEVV